MAALNSACRNAGIDRSDLIKKTFVSFHVSGGTTDVLLCNPDFEGMECIHARLVRKNTCANGKLCDYTICGDKDPYLKDHPEYRDENGYRRNK